MKSLYYFPKNTALLTKKEMLQYLELCEFFSFKITWILENADSMCTSEQTEKEPTLNAVSTLN